MNVSQGLTVLQGTKSGCYVTRKSRDNAVDIVKQCDHLSRIVEALKYYSLLMNAKKLDEGKRLFSDFCDEYYPQFLNDYIHLTTVHSDDLQAIHEDMKTNFAFKGCEMKNCKLERRESKKRGGKGHVAGGYYSFKHFYTDTMANIHFLMYHLRDCGLRTMHTSRPTATSATATLPAPDDQDLTECTDHEFLSKVKEIAKTQKESGSVLGTTKKFTIATGDENDADGGNKGVFSLTTSKRGVVSTIPDSKCTFIDDLYAFIIDKCGKDGLALALARDDYDTESVEADMALFEENQRCNMLFIAQQSLRTVDAVRSFIRNYHISKASFSTGFSFQYHPYYKDVDAEQFELEQSSWNQTDLGGASIADLYVEPRYKSMKAELLASKFLGTADFQEFLVDKGRKYMDTARCRSIRSIYTDDPLHFDIDGQSPLKDHHIYSLLAYTDFSELCTDFSSTYRAAYPGESLKLIKTRNSKYYHTARHLKELVQYFGLRGLHDRVSGPFYCGMGVVLNLPQFSIRLYGPTSTSTHIEVAMRFSGTNGTIIQLNNQGSSGQLESFFDCHWVSAFPEESERLMMGGRYKLEMESVRIIETGDNYSKFMRAFHLFDCMLSGDWPYGAAVRNADIRVVKASINERLDIKRNGYAEYVNNTFHLFCERKTQLILNLCEMDRDIANETFVSIIMKPLRQQGASRMQLNNNNIFKPVVFRLFPNVQEIIMYTTGNFERAYSFNILKFFRHYLCLSPLSKALKKIQLIDRKFKWLKQVFHDEMTQYAEERAWDLEFKSTDLNGARLVLERK